MGLAAKGLAALCFLLLSCSEAPVAVATNTTVKVSSTYEKPADCAKGCSAPTPDETHPLDEEVAIEHLRAFAVQPLGVSTEDLDTLLFHRDVAVAVLDASPGLLPMEHERFLREELDRTRVEVSFRLVDDSGKIRGEATRIAPMREKQHVVLGGTGSLKHIEISGKTKRVGLNHLWSRW